MKANPNKLMTVHYDEEENLDHRRLIRTCSPRAVLCPLPRCDRFIEEGEGVPVVYQGIVTRACSKLCAYRARKA